MTKEEFGKLINLIEKSYPKQKELNNTQKGVFFMALGTYSLEACATAFLTHTQESEWKPQAPVLLLKHLNHSNIEIEKHLKDFLQRKDVKDSIAIKVYQMLGGLSLNKTLEKDYEKLRDKFVEMYRNEKIKEDFSNLPITAKKKLIELV